MIPRSRLPVLRTAALLALGALAVHQLRYAIAFGSETGEALHREGHGYLAQSLPVLVALAAALLVASLFAGSLTAAGGRLSPFAVRAAGYAAALVLVYSAQELVEGMLAPGHPAGVAALLANGGWIALPLAFALGIGAAAAERLHQRGADRIAVIAAPRVTPARACELPLPRPRPAATPLPASPLAFGLARRPPPLSAQA